MLPVFKMGTNEYNSDGPPKWWRLLWSIYLHQYKTETTYKHLDFNRDKLVSEHRKRMPEKHETYFGNATKLF